MKKKIIIILFSLLMLFILLPCTALAADENADGYDDNDFSKLQAFLNQTSSNGIAKNGAVINAAYNDDDPATWTGVLWTDDEVKRVQEINWAFKHIAGSLDVSNFSSLVYLNCFGCGISKVNLSGALALNYISFYKNNLSELTVYANPQFIDCKYNNIASLNLSGKTELRTLFCDYNDMTSLDIGGCVNLHTLFCNNNKLTGTLDVSDYEYLDTLLCHNNLFTSLILSDNNYGVLLSNNNKIKSITIGMFADNQHFTANGDGYISLNMDIETISLISEVDPSSNSIFYNWTSGDTEISKSPIHYLDLSQPPTVDINANFKPALTSDPANGVIYTGGRVSLTPLITGGEWQFDNTYLQADFTNPNKPVFKGLKPGKTQISYTFNPAYDFEIPPGSVDVTSITEEDEEGNYTVTLDITIKDSLLPVTGQNFTIVIILALTSLMAVTAMTVIRRKSKRA